MSVFEHGRTRIVSPVQHPYKHTLNDFFYSNPATGDEVINLQQAMDWVFAVLYPQSKEAVATVGDLPLVGNTLNDFRVVNDDGDGKAAAYRWEQREGEATASWHKIYDMDWGADSIFSGFMNKTLDVYVSKYGHDELDANGNPLIGIYGGQRIIGGASAGTHLTLYANSGDGLGPNTGYVQFGDDVRPLITDTFNLGTATYRFLEIWGVEATLDTLYLGSGVITDTTGTIDFGLTDLGTDGTVGVGTMLIAGGSITDSSGTIDFNNEHLTTTGIVTASHFVGTTAPSSFFSGTTVGQLTLSSGSVVSATGALSFGANNVTTTGSITGASLVGTTATLGTMTFTGNTISSGGTNAALNLAATGSGRVTLLSSLLGTHAEFTNNVTVTGYVDAGFIRLSGSTITTTTVDTDLTITPNGTGRVIAGKSFIPLTDNALTLGATGARWQTLWLSTSVTNGTNTILMSELLSLRSAGFRDVARTLPAQDGDTLFYDTGSGLWIASHPDTEIDHSEITGLTTGDSGHTQFVMLAGRAGGQTVYGGTAASENLTLDSTSHATKGSVIFGSNLIPNADGTLNFGSAIARIQHVYTSGQFYGLRVENVGATPGSSALNVGRLYWNTASGRIEVDTGTTVTAVGSSNRFETDTAWNGSDTTKSVTVTTPGMDARKALWQLRDNTNDFEIMHVKITTTNATTVVITVSPALPVGSYRLIGLE